MWHSSQEGLYLRRIRKPRMLRTSIPLIIPGEGFIALLNSFTGGWCGISSALIGRSGRGGAGQGGPEPFSQKAPYTAEAVATAPTTSADLGVRSRARAGARGSSRGKAGSSSRGFEPK